MAFYEARPVAAYEDGARPAKHVEVRRRGVLVRARVEECDDVSHINLRCRDIAGKEVETTRGPDDMRSSDRRCGHSCREHWGEVRALDQEVGHEHFSRVYLDPRRRQRADLCLDVHNATEVQSGVREEATTGFNLQHYAVRIDSPGDQRRTQRA